MMAVFVLRCWDEIAEPQSSIVAGYATPSPADIPDYEIGDRKNSFLASPCATSRSIHPSNASERAADPRQWNGHPPSMNRLRRAATAFCVALVCASGLHAGPPFLTDDPEPVDLNHWEFYVFGQGDRTAEAHTVTGPAVELNYGVAPNIQLHLVAPTMTVSAKEAGRTSGYGDTELGVKYRFLDETDSCPQVGLFPMAELATGSGARRLGNGRTWYRLPVWVQKSWGPWTTYGGGGVAFNSAPGQRTHDFEGWLVQRDLGQYLTLGTEVFRQGAETTGGRGFTVVNVGGYLKFTEDFNLLFSAGRSLSGERHTLWYLGLYWAGGPGRAAKK
jgi:hypothetical protein